MLLYDGVIRTSIIFFQFPHISNCNNFLWLFYILDEYSRLFDGIQLDYSSIFHIIQKNVISPLTFLCVSSNANDIFLGFGYYITDFFPCRFMIQIIFIFLSSRFQVFITSTLKALFFNFIISALLIWHFLVLGQFSVSLQPGYGPNQHSLLDTSLLRIFRNLRPQSIWLQTILSTLWADDFQL